MKFTNYEILKGLTFNERYLESNRLGRPERFCHFFEPVQPHLIPRE